ncbi:MAG: helix-turn-helix domain-containing protein [Ekhidna sp.]
MIDYYWLKSFTEIIQLFISVLFLIYLFTKYEHHTLTLKMLTLFLLLKFLEDFYGVINYTFWIENILTRDVLNIYRMLMGSLETGMIASLWLLSDALNDQDRSFKSRDFLYYLPSIVLAPFNVILATYFNQSLIEVFMVVRVVFIFVLAILLLKKGIIHMFKPFLIALLIWNILWLSEVFLFEFLELISEVTSWKIFILAETSITIGMTYFLVKVIAKPKLLKNEPLSNHLSSSFKELIENRLDHAIRIDKFYKDPELTLAKLANHLELQPHDLTIYLNKGLRQNFNQFIINLRIDESILLLRDETYKHLSIEQVMLETGFSSKSVFNTSFKDKTGQTPSAFRKQVISK